MEIRESTKDSNLDSENNSEREFTIDEKDNTSIPKRTAAVIGELLRKGCSKSKYQLTTLILEANMELLTIN